MDTFALLGGKTGVCAWVRYGDGGSITHLSHHRLNRIASFVGLGFRVRVTIS